MRQWFEVRVRECVRPGRYINGRWIDGKWTKKSHFYQATSSSDAMGKYHGKGDIISSQKYGRERIMHIGEFFTLGDKLLKELRVEQDVANNPILRETPDALDHAKQEETRRMRRSYFEKERRKAVHDTVI